MKQKIPVGVVAAVIVIVVAGVAYFGWRAFNSGSSDDVTAYSIKHYQELAAQAAAHKPGSPQEAAKMGAPVGGAPMGGAGGSAPMGSAPMGGPGGSAPMGGPGGSAPMGGPPAGGGGR